MGEAVSQGVGSQAPALQSPLRSPQQELRENGLRRASPPERPQSWASLEDSFPGKQRKAFFIMRFAHPSTQSTSRERLKASLDESTGRHHPHWSALRMEGWRAAAEPRDLLAWPVHEACPQICFLPPPPPPPPPSPLDRRDD